jgi:imidazolonepropionase-like amidohydrolase
MIRWLAGSLVFASLVGRGPTGLNGQSTDATAVVDVTIVDVATGELRPNMTVVISGDRIAAVGRADAVDVPPGATLVPGEGRFLIPGLWDMHIHFSNRAREFDLPLYIANGVTGVRNMSGDCEAPCVGYPSLETVRGWRAEIETGVLVGPRGVASSMLFDGPAPMWPTSYALTDPDEGRAKVHRARARGADFLKIYGLPKDVYFAVLDEAHSIGMDAVGHVPAGVTVAEASAAGQKSWEHFDGTELLACSSRRAAAERLRTASRDDGAREARDAYRRFLVESFDEAACAPFFELLKENGTWHVPTLTYYLWSSRPDDVAAATAERAVYLPFVPGSSGVEVSPEREAMMRLRLAYVGAAHRAGAPLLAGTDPWNEGVSAGFSLHDELELFVEAGLSPLDALRTATSAPAEFFGREHELGAIRTGYLADLVLLDANPAEDIANTRQISAVVANGRVFDRGALDELLAGVARAKADAALQGPRPVNRLVWIDRQGNIEPVPVEPSGYRAPRLSPDGRHVAFMAFHGSGNSHIWLADLATGELEQMTVEGTRNFMPVWSLDGRWIYFASDRSDRGGDPDIWRMPSDGSGSAEIIYQAAGPQVPGSISPDGAWLAFEGNFAGESQSRDIGLVPLTGDGEARLLTDTPRAGEWAPSFSPDGRFIAFHAWEGGMAQVYVQEIATGERWMVSAEEGIPAQSPLWTRGGAEIVFMLGSRGQTQPFAVDVTYGPEPSFSSPRKIFEWPAGNAWYDVTPDGERFLMVQPVPQRE